MTTTAELTPFPIAIVTSRFNETVTRKLYEGALTRLAQAGFGPDHITSVWVPGAVEIPLTAQRLAKTGRYQAIICLGAVIYGETDHYHYVCQQVSAGCQQVALQQNMPVIFGILTTQTTAQALARAGTGKDNKGYYSAQAALEMVAVLRTIDQGLAPAMPASPYEFDKTI